MGLFSFFASGRNARLVAELASALSTRSRESVWKQVRDRAVGLPPGQARGYTRAQARRTVERESQFIFSQYPETTSALRQQVFTAALENVVGTVVRDLSSLPARAVVRRAA